MLGWSQSHPPFPPHPPGLTQQNLPEGFSCYFGPSHEKKTSGNRVQCCVCPGATMTLMLHVTADGSVLLRACLSVE